MRTHRRTDRHNEVNCHFSRFCETRLKRSVFNINGTILFNNQHDKINTEIIFHKCQYMNTNGVS